MKVFSRVPNTNASLTDSLDNHIKQHNQKSLPNVPLTDSQYKQHNQKSLWSINFLTASVTQSVTTYNDNNIMTIKYQPHYVMPQELEHGMHVYSLHVALIRT